MKPEGVEEKGSSLSSRRKLLKGMTTGALTTAGAASLSSVGCQAQGGSTNWSNTYDWICVGSGVAGCAVAIFGQGKECKTLIVEKLDKVGGLTTASGGIMWVLLDRLKKAKGIPDPREDAISDLRYMSGRYSRREYMEAFVDNATGPSNIWKKKQTSAGC